MHILIFLTTAYRVIVIKILYLYIFYLKINHLTVINYEVCASLLKKHSDQKIFFFY